MNSELCCANCSNRLDPTDKYCRECGLPTVYRSETQRMAVAQPPNVAELKLAMEEVPAPRPFPGAPDQPASSMTTGPELTTGGVVKITSPTFAMQMAGSTLVMVGLIVVFVVAGIALIVLALR